MPMRIQNTSNEQLLVCLFDSGSSDTIIRRDKLPTNIVPKVLQSSIHSNTIMGQQEIKTYIELKDIVLPEFSCTCKIENAKAYVIDSRHCNYDIIIGRDFMRNNKIDISFKTSTVSWLDNHIVMKPNQFWNQKINWYHLLIDNDHQNDLFSENYIIHHQPTEIKHSKYEATSPEEVIKLQKHLNQIQQQQLLNIFERHPILFSGKLGKYPHQKIHLDIQNNAQPFHAKSYAVPHIHQQVFKDELQRLCQIGVLEKCGGTEWAAGTFIIPKKDGRVRWVSDFRMLNKSLKRRIYPLPKIQDILHRRNGYKYFTKIDLSMQYYAFELDEESSNLCVIVTPFGKYKYKRLPMGICLSTDIAQEIMETVLQDIKDVEIYLDDIGIFSNDWESHLQTIQTVLTKLQENGFSVNPLKCEWAVQETDWLGYWLTPTGLKPWTKKIQAITTLKQPTNLRQLRSFIGLVNYYKEMWPHRSHIMAPLTSLTGHKFVWNDTCQKAFQDIKSIIAQDVLLSYPNHNLPFEIYTDASDYQLGSVIKQNNRPVAYFSKKLNKAQMNYTVEEKEILSIVETLKSFRSMLLGAEIHIFTDHLNLTYHKFTTQRVLRQRLYIEEYHPYFHHIAGHNNIIADALSRLPFEENQFKDQVSTNNECLVNNPPMQELQYPLSYTSIAQNQQQDESLLQALHDNPTQFKMKAFNNINIIVHVTTNGKERICIPEASLGPIIVWYHLTLMHAGQNKLHDTIKLHFDHPRLHQVINIVVQNCEFCQRYKSPSRKYGQLPVKQITENPWETVAVDLIGPWDIFIREQNIGSFSALTMIDIATNLTELVRLDSRDAGHVAQKFENTWLARYPSPSFCLHDNGGEFIGEQFQSMLQRNNIKDKPTTIKNPTANAICERMHLTIENMIRTSINERPHITTLLQVSELVDNVLSSCMFALRASTHQTLQTTPSSIAFGRDMIFNTITPVNFQEIQQKRQHQTDINTQRENRRRTNYEYVVGQQILIQAENPAKLQARFNGPYRIIQVHNNGTVTIQKDENTTQQINIRRIRPFFRIE